MFSSNCYPFIHSDGSMHILKANGHMETRALCEQINKQTSVESQVIAHQTTGWYVIINILILNFFLN